MQVKHLNLVNFRNYSSVDLPLQPGVNLLVGKNGQGKTNLVEAILYCASLSSHRVAGYTPLIKQNCKQAIIRLLAAFNDRENLVEIEINSEANNRARANRAELSRTRDILGYVQAVIFAPEDLVIVKNDPSDRRHFIDDLLVQFSPRLSAVLSDYDRVLKQRNTLLKTSRNLASNSPGLATLDAWDDSLVKIGSEIIAQRYELVQKLRPLLKEAYKLIADEKNDPDISVRSSVLSNGFDEINQKELTTSDRKLIEESFLEKLGDLRTKELERGITLIGPHRDDLLFTLGSLPAKGYISHGETWSFALSLKMASANLLRAEAKAGDPILILDDVFAELDTVRRSRLVDLISGFEQVIITAAVAEDVPPELSATIFRIEDGKVLADD